MGASSDHMGVVAGTDRGAWQLSAVQKRLTLVACILGSSIVFIDGTVVNVALPALREDLDAGLAGQQWVVESYLLMLSSLLLLGGSLSDVLGRRRVFAFGTFLFGLTSIFCAVAPTVEVLIAARALQGAAGALLVPSTLATIVAVFDEHERGKAIGTWTAWSGISTVIGPLAGGALIDAASWRWVFAIGLVPVAATLVLIARAIPEAVDERDPDAHLDVLGAVLAALALGGPVFALIEQPTHGWDDPVVFLPLVGGLTLLAAFIVHERRIDQPMLPLELFRRHNFAVGNLATFAIYAGLGAGTFFLVLFLQQVAGYSALEAGLALLPAMLILFFLSGRFGALADRFGPRLFMGAGPLVAGAGLLLLVNLDARVDFATDVLPAMALFGLGLAVTVAPLTATVLADADQRHAGVASGVNNAIARVAGLVAIAVVGAALSAQFSAKLDDEIAGIRLTPKQAQAVEDARSRPLVEQSEASGSRALDQALEEASVSAFRVGIGICGGLMVAGGLIAAVGIRNPRREVAAAECPGGAICGASEDVGRVPTAGVGEPQPA